MIGNRYELKKNEDELVKIEKDLAKYLNVPFVRCSYDMVNSHKYKDANEVKYRKKEEYDAQDGGYDGEVYELLYLKGNGNYIVITGCAE